MTDKEKVDRATAMIKEQMGQLTEIVSIQNSLKEKSVILGEENRRLRERVEDLEWSEKRYREAKVEIEERWNKECEDNPSEYQGGRLDGLDVAIGILEEALEGFE